MVMHFSVVYCVLLCSPCVCVCVCARVCVFVCVFVYESVCVHVCTSLERPIKPSPSDSAARLMQYDISITVKSEPFNTRIS